MMRKKNLTVNASLAVSPNMASLAHVGSEDKVKLVDGGNSTRNETMLDNHTAYCSAIQDPVPFDINKLASDYETSTLPTPNRSQSPKRSSMKGNLKGRINLPAIRVEVPQRDKRLQRNAQNSAAKRNRPTLQSIDFGQLKQQNRRDLMKIPQNLRKSTDVKPTINHLIRTNV